jgi:anti-anti-sigma factor
MCQYDRLRLDPAEVADAVDLHLEGVRERQLSTSQSAGVLCLRGQVDAVNSDVLASTLRAACQRVDRELRLDLSGLEFIDVTGARALASATSEFRAAGGRAVLLDLQPLVARVLMLLRVDELSGVTLVEDRVP